MIDNLEKILGIELMNAAQGLEFRRPLKSSKTIEKMVADFRKVVPFVQDDIEMHPAMKKSIGFVQTQSQQMSVQDFI
jgi:histidine ammonia-lyase